INKREAKNNPLKTPVIETNANFRYVRGLSNLNNVTPKNLNTRKTLLPAFRQFNHALVLAILAPFALLITAINPLKDSMFTRFSLVIFAIPNPILAKGESIKLEAILNAPITVAALAKSAIHLIILEVSCGVALIHSSYFFYEL